MQFCKYPRGGIMPNEKKNYSHLTYRDRTIIAHALSNNATFTTIAKTLGKSKSTISREVHKNYIVKKSNPFNNDIHNFCVKKSSCNIDNLCSLCEYNVSRCSQCTKCNLVCHSFDPICNKLKYAPFVCNVCESFTSCKREKHIYDADEAEKMYKSNLSLSRKETALNSPFVQLIDKELTPHLIAGKSIHNFLMTQPKKLSCVSRSTVYRWAKNDFFSIKSDDMPSFSKKKPNKDYAYPKPKAKNILTNRTYEDYLKRLKENDFFETVQIDTVLGKRGTKTVILTIFFTSTKLLLAFILKSKTIFSVQETICLINQKLAPLRKTFFDFAPVILLDNGSEFADPLVFEMDNEGELKSSVFYCTPYTATQRPQIERAHVELRRFLPKGSSFDDISQEQLNFILSHLNSYKLSSLNGKSPYQLFTFSYGEAALDALGIRLIPDYDIVRNNKSILKLLNNI